MKKKLIYSILMFLFLFTGVVMSQAQKLPPIIDIELFFGDPQLSGGQLSPNGEFIAFRKPYKDVMNIWVKSISEPFENARPMTADTKRPVTSYFWSRDSKYILYSQDQGGDENFRVYAVDPKSVPESATGVPKAKDLTPLEKVRVYIMSVPKETPNEILIGLNDRDPQYHDVYKLNLTTGERTLLLKNEDKLAGFIPDWQGNISLAIRQTSDGGTELLKINGKELVPLLTVNNEESLGVEGFTPDNKKLYLNVNKGADVDLARLELIDLATGKIEVIESDPEKQVDLGGAVFSDITHEFVGTTYTGDRTRYYWKDKSYEKLFADLKKLLPDGEISLTSMTDDEQLLTVAVASDVDPGSVYLYDRKANKAELLYKSRPDLPTEHLAPMEPVRYTARDGVEIPAYLVVPKGLDAKNLPTIILPHGGPWARDYFGYNSLAQFLANRGYAVLSPNFRGSTGYGKKFLNLGNKQWGTGSMQHDLTDGVKYLVDKGIANPKEVVIMGGSYGGYATLAGVAFTPDLYAAGVSIVGPSNIITLLNSIPAYWEPMVKQFHVRVGNPNIPEERAMLEKQSPLNSAKNIKVPLLVIQGANDPRVKQAESDQIVATLRDLNRNVEYLLAKDEGHGYAGKLNRLAMFARIERFLAKNIDGGRFQEDIKPEIKSRLAELTVDIKDVKLPEVDKGAEEKAKSGDLPEFNSAKIKTGKMNYKSSLSMMGQNIDFDFVREVKIDAGNLMVTDVANTPMGSMTDKYVIDAATLLPISRSTEQMGMEAVKLDYTAKGVKGFMMGMAGKSDVAKDFDAPTLSDGTNFELALASLPLAESYKTHLRYFDANGQSVKLVNAEVKAIEEVTIAGTKYKAFKVSVMELGGTSEDLYWISDTDQRQTLKSEISMPASMGGGKIVSELK
ncbi:MAG: S9 family peptidase [Melioribacteraceae bacterium]